MPRGRRRAAPSDDDMFDSDSELTFTQSQPRSQNKTKSQKVASQPAVNLNEFVTKVVKMILPYAVSKLPVKRAELTNQAMNGDQRATTQVLAKAKEMLAETYQLDLIELKQSKTKQFIIVGKQPALTIEEYTDEQLPELVLLYLILEYIYMKNGEVTDGTLYEYLARFEIFMDNDHEYFGDVKHLIHDVFTKQLYLNFVKNISEGSNVEKITVKWGERAEHEFIKRDMLEFVANFLDCNPSVFLQQYELAYGAEIEAEQLGDEVENLQMSSQPKPTNKRRSRPARVQQMEVDSESD